MNRNLTLGIVFSTILLTVVFVSGCTGNFLKNCSMVTRCHEETYTTSLQGCDQQTIDKCRCLHKGLLGLGSCDSCECVKNVCEQVEECK